MGVSWSPFDSVERDRKVALLNGTLVEALRQLTPGMGAYVNEVRGENSKIPLMR